MSITDPALPRGQSDILKSVNLWNGLRDQKRHELSRLLGELQVGDTLVVAKLDSFGRRVSQILALLVQLQDVGVRVHLMDIGVVDIFSMPDDHFHALGHLTGTTQPPDSIQAIARDAHARQVRCHRDTAT